MLIIHVIIALVTVLTSGLLIIKPHYQLIRLNMASLGLTLITGTTVTLQLHASLTSACLSGLTITACSAASVLQARRRLATASETIR